MRRLTFDGVEVALLAAEGQRAQKGERADGDERDGDGGGHSGAAEAGVGHRGLDRAANEIHNEIKSNTQEGMEERRLPEEAADAAGFALESGRVLRVLERFEVAVLLDGLAIDGAFAIGKHLLGDRDERGLGGGRRGGLSVLNGGTARGADEHNENESCTARHGHCVLSGFSFSATFCVLDSEKSRDVCHKSALSVLQQ